VEGVSSRRGSWDKAPARVRRLLVFALAMGMFVISGCSLFVPPMAESSDILMNTFIRVRAYGPRAGEAADAAIAEMRRLDALFDPYSEASEIAAINRNAGGASVKVSPETLDVMEKALEYARRTKGAFDITILPLIRLWGFGGTPRVPERSEIERARTLVDYTKVEVNREAGTVRLAERGMGIDLGAIAKGYAVDRAVAVLRSYGVTSALIDAGGNIYGLGGKPLGLGRSAPWRVGIQHPRRRQEHLARTDVVNGTVVTSGDYQRYFETGGVRYHHILDPATGYPARGLSSVTIIGTSSTDADALSTSVFVLGPERGVELLKAFPGYDAVLVTESGEVILTDGAAGRVTLQDGR